MYFTLSISLVFVCLQECLESARERISCTYGEKVSFEAADTVRVKSMVAKRKATRVSKRGIVVVLGKCEVI